ncbi:hypothetical protein AAFF_G00222010 [Aldrovandia affinis]|uniref:Exostosin-like 2 n=1 Tax=Aldrovandia affinis TaxID=143900 RepID=A0AAD7RFH4_9TELE|nr:hypothetical protein AAFF_G00222010 [Aldrovandia affinis]
MKFTEHLSAHITPEWRKQYIQYEAFKEMLYAAQDQAPSTEVTDEDTVKRYYAKFEEKFFQSCEKELAKINTFYSEKLAEAQRRFATLQNELQSSLDAQRESSAPGLRRRRKTVFHLSHDERVKHRNIKDLQLAYSEFYLSLILLQNYQNLNFTGFRKILKKHDKILETVRGADWRVVHVEVAPFYTCKKITQLISETEALVTTELEGGDRQKAMKRLRVPLWAQHSRPQPGPPSGWGLIDKPNVWPLVRIYRGGFLLIQFLFLLGINTYGWRQAGVNHVLIFELNPRNNLSHQHLFEIAGFLGVLWCISILSCLYCQSTLLPMQANPLILYGFMLLFLINPFKTCYYKSRFWLLKLLFRVFTAPFHRVEFADFWLADQLNSLVMVLMDLEYLVCFYSFELKWEKKDGLLLDSLEGDLVCHSYSYGVRAVIQCLPAWFRFVQCLRRYRDTKRAFPHLVNAGKYSTTFFVVTFAALYKTHKANEPDDAQVFLYLLIVFSVISSCYTLIWDLKMDWGLFDRSAGENTFLREEIVYPQKAYYYCAIVEDAILRFAWTIPLSLGATNLTTPDNPNTADILTTVLAPLEVFRRFVWNFFRLENEHLNNCDDQTLLEQMMDQEDGVRNRLGKKSWKRSYSMSLRRPRREASQRIGFAQICSTPEANVDPILASPVTSILPNGSLVFRSKTRDTKGPCGQPGARLLLLSWSLKVESVRLVDPREAVGGAGQGRRAAVPLSHGNLLKARSTAGEGSPPHTDAGCLVGFEHREGLLFSERNGLVVNVLRCMLTSSSDGAATRGVDPGGHSSEETATPLAPPRCEEECAHRIAIHTPCASERAPSDSAMPPPHRHPLNTEVNGRLRDSAVLTDCGRSFHQRGTRTEKRRDREERLPGARREGTVSLPAEAERRGLGGVNGRILRMLWREKRQVRVIAAIWLEKHSWLSRVTPRLLADWDGDTMEPSTVIDASIIGEPFAGRKSSSVFPRFSFRCLLRRSVSCEVKVGRRTGCSRRRDRVQPEKDRVQPEKDRWELNPQPACRLYQLSHREPQGAAAGARLLFTAPLLLFSPPAGRCCLAARAPGLAPLLLLLLVGAALTALLPAAEDQATARRRAGGTGPRQEGAAAEEEQEEEEDSFTIIMQTYNRTDVLLRLLNHYQGVARLRRIIVSLGPHPVPVLFKEQSANRMRNRLQAFAELQTNAVLMLDDDTLVSAPDLSFAFSVWKLFPEQIVGFVPRKHVTTASGVYSYGSFELQDPERGGDRYSMVLVGAAFFHRSYLELFQQQPAEVHALVDETQNCDDIAMNFVVASRLAQGAAAGAVPRAAGVFVKPVDMRNLEREAHSGYVGMWHRPEHLLQRSYCLNRLARIYGAMPLRYSNLMLSHDQRTKICLPPVLQGSNCAGQLVDSRAKGSVGLAFVFRRMHKIVGGSTVFLPHSKKVSGSNPGQGPFCAEFACSPVSAWVSSGYSGFLPQSKDMHSVPTDGHGSPARALCASDRHARLPRPPSITKRRPGPVEQSLSNWQSLSERITTAAAVTMAPKPRAGIRTLGSMRDSSGGLVRRPAGGDGQEHSTALAGGKLTVCQETVTFWPSCTCQDGSAVTVVFRGGAGGREEDDGTNQRAGRGQRRGLTVNLHPDAVREVEQPGLDCSSASCPSLALRSTARPSGPQSEPHEISTDRPSISSPAGLTFTQVFLGRAVRETPGTPARSSVALHVMVFSLSSGVGVYEYTEVCVAPSVSPSSVSCRTVFPCTHSIFSRSAGNTPRNHAGTPARSSVALHVMVFSLSSDVGVYEYTEVCVARLCHPRRSHAEPSSLHPLNPQPLRGEHAAHHAGTPARSSVALHVMVFSLSSGVGVYEYTEVCVAPSVSPSSVSCRTVFPCTHSIFSRSAGNTPRNTQTHHRVAVLRLPCGRCTGTPSRSSVALHVMVFSLSSGVGVYEYTEVCVAPSVSLSSVSCRTVFPCTHSIFSRSAGNTPRNTQFVPYKFYGIEDWTLGRPGH